MVVWIEKMQYGDVEMPVSGIVLDERGNPGLLSWIKNLSNLKLIVARYL